MLEFDPEKNLTHGTVLPEWIDGNGHMNVAYYVLAFDQALGTFCDYLDVGWSAIQKRNDSIFVLENHITYQNEVLSGDDLRFTLQVLDIDEKCFHYFMRMYHASKNYLAATAEQIALHVGLDDRRAKPMPPTSQEKLAAIFARHKTLPRPPEVGRAIGIRRRATAS